MPTEVEVTDELAEAVDQRIRTRRYQAQAQGAQPLPLTGWQAHKQTVDEQRRQERLAAARAEDERLREAREAAEAERRREWEKNAPARAAAQRELDLLAPQLAALDTQRSELLERVRGLRQQAGS